MYKSWKIFGLVWVLLGFRLDVLSNIFKTNAIKWAYKNLEVI